MKLMLKAARRSHSVVPETPCPSVLLLLLLLLQIVSRLAPEDVARLGCVSSRLQAHISSGRLALHLW
jgi:hypothetical protein